MAKALKVGTKVRTLSRHSETAKVVRPRKSNLPLPGPDWAVIEFNDGKRVCAHRDGLAAA